MGELAKTLVSLSGPEAVHGVIPRALIRTEKGYEGTKIGEQGRIGTPPVGGGNNIDNNHHDSTNGHDNGAGKQAERTLSREDTAQIDSAKAAQTSQTNGVSVTLLNDSEFGSTTIVPDMHTRKRLMASKVVAGGPGSGFVALAGGYGTIEEIMEMVTWNQLGIHRMPIVLVNVDGYWDGLVNWLNNAVEHGFVSKGNAGILVEVKNPKDVVAALQGYEVSKSRYELDWN